MKTFVVLMSALLLASPAAAQISHSYSAEGSASNPDASASTNAQPSGAASGEGEQRQICRRIENGNGSRVAMRRVCKTAQEWRNYDNAG